MKTLAVFLLGTLVGFIVLPNFEEKFEPKQKRDLKEYVTITIGYDPNVEIWQELSYTSKDVVDGKDHYYIISYQTKEQAQEFAKKALAVTRERK